MSHELGARASKPVQRDRHQHRIVQKNRQRVAEGEKGYILVVMTIVLPVLVLFIALATDVTYLYARSIELQRVADSAALAGVTRMPVESDARSVAIETAKLNGVENSFGGVTVSANAATDSNRRLKVTVRDAKIPLFFGRIIKDHWDVTRTSTAEYTSNIPLGSALNAIGTGPMTNNSLSATPQNFWLSIAGPCAPKELGDQISSRYDGNSVNATQSPGKDSPANKAARLCDYDNAKPAATQPERLANMAAKQAAQETLFPSVSINRDYDPSGYNYIIDAPCDAGRPIPCEPTDLLDGAITIQVFDPVFNPDSVQRYSQFDETVKPDSYGVPYRQNITNCTSGTVATGGCDSPSPTVLEPANLQVGVNPKDVRVVTDVRLYTPDSSPSYFGDDAISQVTFTGSNLVDSATDPFVPAGEANKVLRFGSCVNITDAWTSVSGPTPTPIADANHDFVPDVAGGDIVTPAVLNPLTQEVLNAKPFAADPDCAGNASQWRTIAVIPETTRAGRLRLNLRTLTAQHSFGRNAFAIRAFFGPTYSSCSTLSTLACASVSGESAMSVFASVPEISRFFLAKLSPASEFQGKKIVLQLWDPGEGGEKLEVLRPVTSTTSCTAGDADVDPNDATASFCRHPFDWGVWAPGINEFGAEALQTSGDGLTDPCITMKQVNQKSVSVSGSWTNLEALGCTALGSQLVNTREGFSSRTYVRNSYGLTDAAGVPISHVFPTGADKPCNNHSNAALTLVFECQSGRFNDRSLAIQIEIPQNYGCATGTGLNGIVCTPEALPMGGWWKIKYTPVQKTWAKDPMCGASTSGTKCSDFIGITDLTTWKVQLLGDPVHLVKN